MGTTTQETSANGNGLASDAAIGSTGGSLGLADTAQKKPETVRLRSQHDYALTVDALEHRKDVLEKLEKKNQEEGYTREAKVIRSDRDAIEYHILPQFRAQRELPFVTEQQLAEAVEQMLRVEIFRAFDRLDDPKAQMTAASIRSRRDALVKTLASRVHAVAVDTAERAFQHGYAMRETTSERLVMDALQGVRAD